MNANVVVGDNGYHLRGRLTRDTVSKLLNEASLDLSRATTLDLTEVDTADSAGLALLLEWTRIAKLNAAQLTLVNVPKTLKSLIEISGLDQVLSVLEK